MWVRLSIVLIVLGCMLGYGTYQESGLWVRASSEPERIALKDLIARGAEGNPHVLLTDFELGENYVYSAKKDGTAWEEVWVPLIPDTGQVPLAGEAREPTRLEALLYSKHCHHEADLTRLDEAPELKGMVMNRIRSLGSEERDLLAKHYPGTDWDHCLIVEEGRGPMSLGLVALGFVGSAVLIALGLLLLVFRVVRRRA